VHWLSAALDFEVLQQPQPLKLRQQLLRQLLLRLRRLWRGLS
jgi:hypothetical protein